VGSTNLASVGSAALEMLHDLAYAAARHLEQHLRPLVDGLRRLLLPDRPQPRLAPPAADEPPPPPTMPTPVAPSPALIGGQGGSGELPRAYGLNRVVVLARDPWWLFAHWEISPVDRVEALRALGAEGEGVREVLRVHGPDGDGLPSWDLELEPGAQRLHFRVEHPGRAYRVEVGLRTPAGRFLALVSSNTVTTPPAGPSPDLSVRWVALSGEGTASEVAGTWSGRRLPDEGPTAGGHPAGSAVTGPPSSDSLPRSAPSSDVLPLR
jgi:hypothetical protein